MYGVPAKQFFKDLGREISEDNISNGAAALAYYLMLAIFPAMIFLLSLIPYLPIPNVHEGIMEALRQALPGEAAQMFEGIVREVTSEERGSLLSFGLLFTIWAASNGMYAIMQELNITYDVKERRPFWKTRGIAIFLTVLFTLMIMGAFALIVFGGQIQGVLAEWVGWNQILLTLFALFRWSVILILILMGFAVTYYFGPDVEQKFRFITPGSVTGCLALIVASLLFRYYVTNFGNYTASYGSIGAVIVFMLWLYIAGQVLLLGSEVNALIEHYSATGKQKGEKQMPTGVNPAKA